MYPFFYKNNMRNSRLPNTQRYIRMRYYKSTKKLLLEFQFGNEVQALNVYLNRMIYCWRLEKV